MERNSRSAGGGYRWLMSEPNTWPSADPAMLGLADPDDAVDYGDLLAGVLHDWRGEGFLAFHRYRILAAIHRERIAPLEARALDDPTVRPRAARAFARCAGEVAKSLGISQRRGEGMLQHATDLFTRLPQVATRLRDGVITDEVVQILLKRTDLITELDADEEGSGSALAAVDAEIAAELDRRAGAWSTHLARDVADRIVFRRQPTAVAARRAAAKADRRVWTSNKGDDMGLLIASMTGDRVRISMAAIRGLANAVCPDDPRTTGQRNSDAVFALLNQLPFACECGNPTSCTTTVRHVGDAVGTALLPVKTRTVLHVVADKATTSGVASNPGFMDGHGVVSGAHIRDLLDDPTTVVSPLGPYDRLGTDDGLVDLLNHLNTFDEDSPIDDGSDVSDGGGDGDGHTDHGRDDSTSRGGGNSRSSNTGGVKGGGNADNGAKSTLRGVERDTPHKPEDPRPTPGRPLRERPTPPPTRFPQPTSTLIVEPATQPADPYRPSAALDLFVRIRDGYTLIPGNAHSAFHCDLDHWREFNHHDPAAGGPTDPTNLGAKDRFGHNQKTVGDWIDDLIVDADGYATPIFITPDRVVIEGRPGGGIDLFPGLRRYRFAPPDTSGLRRRTPPKPPSSHRPRTADKHARRQAERERNRAAERSGTLINPRGVQRLIDQQRFDDALGDPPY